MKTQNKKFAGELSTRCKNGLIGCFGYRDIIHLPGRIARAGVGKLLLARNIGVGGLQEIAEALYKHGYIDDSGKWLEG